MTGRFSCLVRLLGDGVSVRPQGREQSQVRLVRENTPEEVY